MKTILKEAKKQSVKLEKVLANIDAFLESAPEGCLKWQNRNGQIYYYHQFANEEDERQLDKWKRKYIKKKNISLAHALAQKHYYVKVRPIIEHNLNEIKEFLKRFQQDELDEIYDSLSAERKKLVVPVQISVKEKLKQWREEHYEMNPMYQEYLKYETEQGELVRSKSEVIIANLLYQHQNSIVYKYERPLELIEKGHIRTIYPDFTIFNVYTGNVVYWEHAGRMDDSHYANEFVMKMNTYMKNGLLPGRDVIVTFETLTTPLDINIVKSLIKDVLSDRI